ncbi:hypothetical protein H2199_000246 [Coniosporium tulheliwenetii]|uniref:Uncharacterized protein n=1 Tax=Coniosporium tulheliwenetii TaxID=3383036 RepID=A0ACC2ZPH1_9PEZI|nr:hypothetical protein H2199_000246 [Cladosporium sp. JES 115]
MRIPFISSNYRYAPLSVNGVTVRPHASPTAIASIVFIGSYLLAILYIRHYTYRDPTSVFFDYTRAYEPAYSAIRQRQADSFIDAAGTTRPFSNSTATSGKALCVGIASVARENARYFRTTVGSILEGLGEEERQKIHLILFIAHTDPTVHPAYSEAWLHNTADQVLVYDLPADELKHIKELEQEKGLFREKALFDYTYLLKACSAAEAPYIAMLEDDVVAMDGWFHRTQHALDLAEKETALTSAALDFLYLRLFYTEEFLGWNSEEWPTYLFYSVLTVSISAAILLSIRRIRPTKMATAALTNRNILIICGICIPAYILLFFAAGRATVLPLPHGLNEMNKFGCCSQGFVFPRSRAQDLIEYYTSRHVGFVDMLTEEYADERGETRWAITPPVIQHVGRKSSKGDDFGKNSKYHMSVAEKLWNFEFEKYDAESLRREHEMILRKGGD